jgi:hypothetical protein
MSTEQHNSNAVILAGQQTAGRLAEIAAAGGTPANHAGELRKERGEIVATTEHRISTALARYLREQNAAQPRYEDHEH